MRRYDLFRNLMIMAVADGKITEEEIQFLSSRSARWGISDEEFALALEAAGDDKSNLVLPESEEQRDELLRELIQVMAVDGELAEAEKQLFAAAAAHMEISAGDLNRLIDEVLTAGGD